MLVDSFFPPNVGNVFIICWPPDFRAVPCDCISASANNIEWHRACQHGDLSLPVTWRPSIVDSMGFRMNTHNLFVHHCRTRMTQSLNQMEWNVCGQFAKLRFTAFSNMPGWFLCIVANSYGLNILSNITEKPSHSDGVFVRMLAQYRITRSTIDIS